jgi:hypothetical protein
LPGNILFQKTEIPGKETTFMVVWVLVCSYKPVVFMMLGEELVVEIV